MDCDKILALSDELARLIEVNDAWLDDELLAAQEEFEHESAMHFPELLRRWKRLRELLSDAVTYRTAGNCTVFRVSDKQAAELRELLDLPAEGK